MMDNKCIITSWPISHKLLKDRQLSLPIGTMTYEHDLTNAVEMAESFKPYKVGKRNGGLMGFAYFQQGYLRMHDEACISLAKNRLQI